MSRFTWRGRHDSDSGMTLPEVIVAVTVTGLITTSIAMAASVILRQSDNTEGRTNNARSEQNVGLYMPTDLASAEAVSTDPTAMPCGPTPACPPGADVSGSNALMLTWHGSAVNGAGQAVETTTNVSYRVTEIDGEYVLRRVECTSIGGGAPTCSTRTVLHDLDAPPGGTEWIPGVTAPSWVMTVSNALAPDDPSGPGDPVVDPGLDSKNAQRVIVTINGGGDVSGRGGGTNQISLSAGGTNRQYNLTTDDLVGAPTFTAARSRCGGNFGVVVDRSGSIGSTNMATVRSGVKEFIEAFAGTPVKVEVVTFSSTSTTLGAGAGWSKWYDMLSDSDVAELRSLVDGVSSNGGTNWEDGFFRMLRNSDGTVPSVMPNTILFFTDGIPTFSRLDGTSASVAAVADPADGGLPASNGSDFSQIGWNRTERLLRDRGAINLIGVYVNSNLTATSDWTVAGAGYHDVWEMGNTVVFQQGTQQYERGNTVVFQQAAYTYEKGNTVLLERSTDSDLVFERLVSGTWTTTTWTTFSANNTTPDSSDGWRTRVTGSLGSSSWTSTGMTVAQYDAANSAAGSSDGFRSRVSSTPSSWSTVTAAQYNASNTTSDSSDGWRITTTWSNVTQAAYDAGNVDAGTSDGFRTQTSGTSTSWTTVTSADYSKSNTTSDSSDGWRTTTIWSGTDQLTYEAGNSSPGESDLWRTQLTGTPTAWVAVSSALYNESNTASGESDGWRTYRSYSPPFTSYESVSVSPIKDYATIGNLVVGNTNGGGAGGEGSGYVEALPRGGPYTNAAAADLFVLPNYTNFASALRTIAVGQCGGTVTMQTKVGSTPAQDPFTYENAATHEVVTTSAVYRSGTFDIALPGGSAVTVTISPQDFTNLSRYQPAGWSCKSGGVAYPFTANPIPGHSPWTSITLSVNPNQAVSCVQQVTFS